jgi:hypothetical protein
MNAACILTGSTPSTYITAYFESLTKLAFGNTIYICSEDRILKEKQFRKFLASFKIVNNNVWIIITKQSHSFPLKI